MFYLSATCMVITQNSHGMMQLAAQTYSYAMGKNRYARAKKIFIIITIIV